MHSAFDVSQDLSFKGVKFKDRLTRSDAGLKGRLGERFSVGG